jgi:hypothetical protein
MRSPGMFACCSLLVACGGGNGADVVIRVTAPDDFGGGIVQLVLGEHLDVTRASITPDDATARKGVMALIKPTSLSTPIAAGETVELSIGLGELDGIDVVAALAGPGVSGPDGVPEVASPTAAAFRYRVAKLPGDDYTKYALTLSSVVDVANASPEAVVWGAGDNTGPERCVYLRDDADTFRPAQAAQLDTNNDGVIDGADDDVLRSVFLIAHADDVDCDGFAKEDTRECAPDVYLDDAATMPALDELDCLVHADSSGNGSGACRVGGPTCVDGTGKDAGSCVPSRYCAGSDLCACEGAPDVRACLLDLPAYTQPAYVLDCKIYAPYVTAGTATALCESSATVELPLGGCDEEILGATPAGGFGTELTWTDAQQHVALETTAGANACTLTIKPSGHLAIPPGDAMAVARGAVLAVPLANGSGLALPARFTFAPESDAVSGCTNLDLYATTCELRTAPDTALEQCLATPPP